MLTERYADALQLAWRLHDGQVRKGTSIPYISHLLGVSSLALEHGATEDEAIAALLHDARSILSDLRVLGPAVWTRFTARRDGTLWYYRSLVQAFGSHGRTALVDEFDLVLSEMERVAAT